MAERKIGGIQGRIGVTGLYAMLCALEIRGLILIHAGKNVLDLPNSWKIAFGAFCFWWLWEVFRTKDKKSGHAIAIFTTIFDGFGLFGFVRSFPSWMVGHKILEAPSSGETVFYAFVIAVILLVAFYHKPGKAPGLGINDRIAALMLAVLFATKIGMRYLAGHDAIVLKQVGCYAIALGTILMLLGLLNALSPVESEFPQIPATAPAIQPPPAKSRTMKGAESPSQEQPLGLRRLARLDQSSGKSRRTHAYWRRGIAGAGNYRDY
jgi:hypothetical protein